MKTHIKTYRYVNAVRDPIPEGSEAAPLSQNDLCAAKTKNDNRGREIKTSIRNDVSSFKTFAVTRAHKLALSGPALKRDSRKVRSEEQELTVNSNSSKLSVQQAVMRFLTHRNPSVSML